MNREKIAAFGLGAVAAIVLGTVAVTLFTTSRYAKAYVSKLSKKEIDAIIESHGKITTMDEPPDFYMLRKRSTELFFDPEDTKTKYAPCRIGYQTEGNATRLTMIIFSRPHSAHVEAVVIPITETENLERYHLFKGVTEQDIENILKLYTSIK
jgi:hypothetical protein